MRAQMFKSFAFTICAIVMFVVYCVVSQAFHPPMYLQTLKNWKVNDTNYKAMLIRLLEDKFFILQEIFSQAILPCANKF